MSPEAEIISITEAAERLGVNASTLRRRCEQGQMPNARKSRGTWLVEWPLVNPPKPRPRNNHTRGGNDE